MQHRLMVEQEGLDTKVSGFCCRKNQEMLDSKWLLMVSIRSANLSQSYSMWPVILTTYNLPPWLCMKESSFMLTLLIPGPKSPGKDIDVYLRPLIDDLKDLWAKPGGEIRRCYRPKACPTCNKDTPSVRVLGKTAYVGHRRFLKKPHKWRRSLEFNGETENGDPPREFNRDAIMTQLARLPTRVKGKHPSPEIDTYRAKFKSEFPDNDMKEAFPGWFRKQIRQRHVDNDPGVSESSELFALACGPSQTPISVNSCIINGVRFVVHSRDERRTTQNNDICSPGSDGEMYYGQLEQILEFSYLSFKTVLFRVKWFDTSNKGRMKNLVIRNNITQIKTNGEAFKNDQYILATQVKQCFYLEDMARRPLGWKVVEHVSHKKFSNGGVIVVEDDPDVIHVDNSSDLALSTSLNDLEIAALHIDGQSIDVDAPPDIIDVVDEDDDIIDEEDPIPHDLADSDDEDLVNLDIDDGMSADVARGHGGDGGGDDRPPSHHIPTGCGGCLGNRGKGTRKPNLGGRRAGRQHTRQETRNLGLKAITDKSGPVPIRFEFGDRETLMPLGEHAAHWANYLGELVRELPLHHPSWRQVPPEQKAGVMARIGTQFDMRPHMESDRWPLIYAAIQQHLQKIYNGKKAALKERHWIPDSDGTYNLADYHVLRTFPRSIGIRRLRSGMIPRTVPGLPKINKTGKKARSYADKGSRSIAALRDMHMGSSATREYPSLIHTFFLTHTVNGVFLNPEDKALYEEMLRLQGLSSNTETEDVIMVIVRGGKQRGHIPGVGRLFRSDDKFSQMLTQLESQPEIGGGSESGGRGDDEQGDDEDDGEDIEDENDS
ncbi:reverse transcriptase domain-containing protein [Tanacetum coccineum]|uniref:Reverse transcriptase domain-containing protein n=1 Tax=Tanacetum coccineum TaxID=301880 RepID=A0ABQ4ZQH1_9ASTR